MWDGGRRYYARFEYDQKQFHCRVMKAVVDGGLSCPNLDGTKGTGGCIFCDGGPDDIRLLQGSFIAFF